MNVVEVQNLYKTFKVNTSTKFLAKTFKPKFKEVHAVNDISFNINQGESVAFLGPNGAGKTTTTKMLTGLIYPSKGSIKVLGYKPQDRTSEFLKSIGLVMGNKSGLSWDLTSRQTFRLYKDIYEISDIDFERRLKYLSDILNVVDFLDIPVRKLSLGERMKLEMISAILHDPKILFLDEPTIGLDVVSKQNIRKFLKEIQTTENITILMTSHDMDDIEKVCDRVMVINHGKLIYDDSMDRLKKKYSQEKYVKIFFNGPTPTLENINIIEKGDSYILIKSLPNLIPSIINSFGTQQLIDDIDIYSEPLEEMFKMILE